MFKRFAYILRLALHSLQANVFVTTYVIALLTAGMMLTMLCFGYIRAFNATQGEYRLDTVAHSVRITLNTSDKVADIYAHVRSLCQDDIAWSTMWVFPAPVSVYAPQGYTYRSLVLVEPDTFPQRLDLSPSVRAQITQKLSEGYLILSEVQAADLGLLRQNETVTVGTRTYPAWIVRGAKFLGMLGLAQLDALPGTPIAADIFLLPKDGISPELLLERALAATYDGVNVLGATPQSITTGTGEKSAQLVLDNADANRSFYLRIAIGGLVFSVMLLFSSVDNKVRRERRDSAVKLAVGAGWRGLMLQQFIEMLLCAAVSSTIAAVLVHLIQSRVLNANFDQKYILFDAYAISWAGVLGIIASILISFGVLWRLSKLRIQRLLREDA